VLIVKGSPGGEGKQFWRGAWGRASTHQEGTHLHVLFIPGETVLRDELRGIRFGRECRVLRAPVALGAPAVRAP
jgi:hypothetical protein